MPMMRLVPQFCLVLALLLATLTLPIRAFAACTSPAGTAGQMLYNTDFNVLQYCNSTTWIGLGPSPGTGGSGCTSPTGTKGALIYNREYQTPQYCDGAIWVALYDTGLVHRWKMNDSAAGTTIADSVGSVTCSMSGTRATVASPAGYGLKFTNSSGSCTGVSEMVGVQKFTISGWMKRTTANGVVAIGWSDPINVFSAIVLYSDGLVYFDQETTTTGLDGTITLNDTNWHFYTFVFDATQSTNATKIVGYVDGVKQTLSFYGTTAPATTDTSAHTFWLGRHDYDAKPANGSISDVRFYNRALSDNDVAALYYSTYDIVDTSLIAWYRMNEGAGTTASDGAATPNNCTLTSSPTWVKRNTDAPSGAALNFSNSYLACGTAMNVTVPFTLSAWVNPIGDYTDFNTIMAKRNDYSSNAVRFSFQLESGDGKVLINTVSASPTATFNYTPPSNQWTQLTMVVNASTVDLYVNGVFQETVTATISLGATTTAQFQIGRAESFFTNYFLGQIDEARVYSRALSAAEILQLYHATGAF